MIVGSFLKNRVLQKSALNFSIQASRVTRTDESGNVKVECFEFSDNSTDHFKATMKDHFKVHSDFISDSEEESLLSEIEPKLRRMRYEKDHWDAAIARFRECQLCSWNNQNSGILERVRAEAMTGLPTIRHAHVLDLHEEGHVGRHVDSVRFCGPVIAGLSLLSDSVMRLCDSSHHCKVLLKRRSLYVMSGPVRYDFSHEILPNSLSFFRGQEVPRKRRISVILRSDVISNH